MFNDNTVASLAGLNGSHAFIPMSYHSVSTAFWESRFSHLLLKTNRRLFGLLRESQRIL